MENLQTVGGTIGLVLIAIAFYLGFAHHSLLWLLLMAVVGSYVYVTMLRPGVLEVPRRAAYRLDGSRSHFTVPGFVAQVYVLQVITWAAIYGLGYAVGLIFD